MRRRKLNLTATLSISLNFELRDKGRHHTAMLPLAWVSMELSKWQQLVGRIQTALTIGSIVGRSVAWGVGL